MNELAVKSRSGIHQDFVPATLNPRSPGGFRYGIAMAALAWLLGSVVARAVIPAHPNVLFIAYDDLRVDLGCYGDPVAITPNIDALAKQSVRFSRAYTQQAVCNASRQSLLTGRRPDTIRVWDLVTHFRTTSPGLVTLPEYFKKNGYFAQSFGKIFHGEAPMADPPSWSVPEQLQYIAKRDDYQLEENRVPKKTQKAAATEFAGENEDDYPDGKVALGAIGALEQYATEKSGQPFFLAVGFMKPHLPFTAPKKYWEMFAHVKIPPIAQPEPPKGAPELALHDSAELRGYSDMPHVGAFSPEQIARLRQGYYASSTFTDAQLGRVLAALKRTGLDQNTVIVLWSDHGYHLGEHGLWAKTTNYETDTRIPLLIAYPGQKHGGQTAAALSELLDLYPTLVDLCGLPKPAGLEGQSLRPWLEDPTRPGREAAFSQFPRPWTYKKEPAFMGYAVRTAQNRYVEWRKFGTREVVARELYFYQGEDLFEKENVAEDPANASLVQHLAALLPAGPK